MIGPTEFGDVAIEGSATTLDDINAVPIYELTSEQDGAYSLIATVVAWQPGGASVQFYLQAAFRRTGGALFADGAPLLSAIGNLSPAGVTIDTSGQTGRLLVTGVASEPVLWRMKGHRFDLTAGRRGAVSATTPNELGDAPVSGSAFTNDAAKPVPIHTFTPEKDGLYSVQAIILAWQPGGNCVQYYVQNNWRKVGGTVAVDGAPYIDSTGTLSPGGITADVATGAGRLLVTGVAGNVLWRMKGVRFAVTA
jgi:hypothetical protein